MLLLALLLFASSPARAFPEMVRHGYVNCISCHVSPVGGGLLTPYGRALGKELLSHGSFFFERAADIKSRAEDESEDAPKEEDFLYGAVKPPKWLSVGGDIRLLQFFQETERVSAARFILMQADLEAMFEVNRIRLVGTLGRREPMGSSLDTDFGDYAISRRHWLGLLLGPGENRESLQFRAGRFFPAYGIYVPDHIVVTRRGLRFDQEEETYNAELSYLGDEYQVTGTAVFGRPDQPDLRRERGWSSQISRALGTTSKAGVNAYTGIPADSPDDRRRTLVGGYGILGFSPSWYLMAELDFAKTRSSGWKMVDYARLGHELTQGFQIIAAQEYFQDSSEAYSAGIQYYPRVHWEFLALIRKQRNPAVVRSFDTGLSFVLHYYL